MGIVAGLNTSSVNRLKATKTHLSKKLLQVSSIFFLVVCDCSTEFQQTRNPNAPAIIVQKLP